MSDDDRSLSAEDLLAARFLTRADFAATGSPPATVGDYTIEGELGRGGMGVVYAARDHDLGREVAIKRLSGAFTPATIERFLREGRAAARLQHPGIVTTLHAGRDDDGPYLVLERIDGESLAEVLEREGALDPRRAAELIRQAAEAVAHAHAADVLHRDIKPGNLLLRADGRLALSDFGLAKLLDDPSPTQPGEVLGTPATMSPEQVRGGPVDARADVYGLGATLYALLTGRPPFAEGSVWTTLTQVAEQEPARPSQVRPEVPAALEAICLCCLRKRPAERYPSARALADDLARFLAGAPVTARPPSRARRLLRGAHARRVPLLIATVLLTLGATWLATRSASDARRWAEADRLLQEAQQALTAHDDPDAIAERLARALALDSGRAHAMRAAGLYADLGRLEQARATLEASRAAHPPGYPELLQLHELERRGARLPADAMTEPLRRLIRIADERGDAGPLVVWSRGKQALAAGDLRGALRWLDAAIAKQVPAYLERGVVRRRLGDLAGARADFEAARAQDPRHPWPPFNLGVLAYQAGELERAQRLLDEAVVLRRRFGPAFTWRGLVRLARGDLAGARADLAAGLTLPGPPEPRARAAQQLLLLTVRPLLAPSGGPATATDLGAPATAVAAARREVLVGAGR